MSAPARARRRLRRVAVAIAHHLETGLRDHLSRAARRRGWTPALLPYPGYATAHHARVLGRVVLAPASVDPAAARGISAWRRLLTLECPGTEVRIEFDGADTTVSSNEAGIIDARVPRDSTTPPGAARALLHLPGREPVGTTVHVSSPDARRGVVCDIDDTVWITGISHPIRAARRMLLGTSSTRRSVPGMARLLQEAVRGQEDPAVVYLSNGPWNLVGPVSRFLDKQSFPAGAVLMTDWGTSPDRWFRDGRAHKRNSLARLRDDLPDVEWVLVGDDGEHDPGLYSDFARAHPGGVAAIVLRSVQPGGGSVRGAPESSVNGVPVVHGADGDALLPLLTRALGRH